MPDPSTHTPLHLHRLLSAARPLEPVRSGKVVLPLSSWDKKILSGKIVVRSKSQVAGLFANRLLVADPQKWRISSFRAGPRIGGWHVSGDHPALSDPGPGSIASLPLLPIIDDDVELEIEYVGSALGGEHFVACLCAEKGAQGTSSTSGPVNPKDSRDPRHVSFLVASRPVAYGEQICLPLPPRAHDLHVSDLVLRVAEPTHWLVSDVLIGGDTLFVEAGNLPGELLADRPGRAALRLGRLRAREDLVVQATYVGPQASALLGYEVSGSEEPTSDVAADSAFLPMSHRVTAIGESLVRSRVGVPRGFAFLPEEVVLRDPDTWVVSDVRVGHMSQFACSGYVPGTLFGTGTRGCQLNFSAVQYDDELGLHVRGVGPNTGGIICGAVGRVIRMP